MDQTARIASQEFASSQATVASNRTRQHPRLCSLEPSLPVGLELGSEFFFGCVCLWI